MATGPARFLAEHPAAFAAAVAAAGLALALFAGRAARGQGLRRLGWALLAAGQAAQVAGLVGARRQGRAAVAAEGLPAWG